MIEMFSSYIRGIIFFLLFASFVGIILPSGKYKSYISIVLGFVVVFLVFEPIGKLSGVKDMDWLVKGVNSQLNVANQLSGYRTEDIEAERKKLIEEAFNDEMKVKVAEVLDDYDVVNLKTDIDLKSGELKEINLSVTKKKSEEKSKKEKLVHIEPVKIKKESQKDNSKKQTAEIAEIKKIISNFYNLPQGHIYVNVQERN